VIMQDIKQFLAFDGRHIGRLAFPLPGKRAKLPRHRVAALFASFSKTEKMAGKAT
jgi:hypothetical protein